VTIAGEQEKMVSLFIFNSRVSSDETALGTPDLSEAKSLPHHVERCAMRYRLFTQRLSEQGQAIGRVEMMIIGLILFTTITSQPFRDIIIFVKGIL
jgi:hypothetical protein